VTATATAAAESPSKGRIVAARVLLVLGVILLVLSILSTYVKREALDSGQFKQTSQQLIADPAIQEAVAAQMTDALANVDFTSSLEAKLPTNLQPLASPIAGLAQGFVGTAAENLLARPRIQDAFVNIAVLSQQQFVKVLHGETQAVDTSNGDVVLDIRPLVLKLGDRFGFVTNLADQIPPAAGQVTILKADNLDTAQKLTHWLEQMANFVWIFALAAFVAAIWLARGRRRQEVRALGIGLVVVGVIVLVVRWLAGKYIVDQLVASDSMRPAVHNAWQIITQSLAAAGWIALVVGILVAIGAWLVGPGERATAARLALAPQLRRPEIAWSAFVVLMLLLIWLLPIQVFRTTAVLVVAAAIGYVVFLRQLKAESPAPAPAALPDPPPTPPPADGTS
jgi:hypothetical protein